ncbi:MAG: cellulase family glycosylhydrolase [Myxococcales bacterium]
MSQTQRAREGLARVLLVVVLVAAGSCGPDEETSEPLEEVGRVESALDQAKAFSPFVFNVKYYRTRNADLASMTDAQLQSHWWTTGIGEGRRASSTFDVQAYARLNPDLVTAYGTGSASWPQHVNHYVVAGVKEGRASADDFYVKEYLRIYADLQKAFGINYVAAANHYLTRGYPIERRVGRVVLTSPLFNLDEYKKYNPDIAENYDDYGATMHWLVHGVGEGRRASYAIHSAYYLGINPELRAANPTNLLGLHHFFDTGMVEGRPSAPDFHVKEYSQLYADVAAQYGTSWRWAIQHYEDVGRRQNRIGRVGSPRMLKRQLQDLVNDAGQKTMLRGVAFGNSVWGLPTQPPAFHHNEDDFARISQWGMNAVRFYLNYQLLEDDPAPGTTGLPRRYKKSGWDWIDKNIEWARAHGVYLVLNVHVPQGGYQSTGGGTELWTNVNTQQRLIDMWAAIARRYRNEPTIAGYDILNEATPANPADWPNLAQRIVNAIRVEDPLHVIVVERAINGGSFFMVQDDNILYQFHFYSPIEYTHQFADWTSFGEGRGYPADFPVLNEQSGLIGVGDNPPPPQLPSGTTGWQLYTSARFAWDASTTTMMRPALTAERAGGKVYFDDLVVKEFAPNGAFVRNVVVDPLETIAGFDLWKPAGASGDKSAESTGPHGGSTSVAIANSDHWAVLTNQAHFFTPKPGHTYSVEVWMRGDAVWGQDMCRPHPEENRPQCPRAMARLEFWKGGAVAHRNQAALAAEIDDTLNWAALNKVPVYLGEFGVIYHCYEDNRGGITWVNDVFDTLLARNVHFTFHAYHEPNFAVYRSNPNTTWPTDGIINQPLIDLFKAKLGGH